MQIRIDEFSRPSDIGNTPLTVEEQVRFLTVGFDILFQETIDRTPLIVNVRRAGTPEIVNVRDDPVPTMVGEAPKTRGTQ